MRQVLIFLIISLFSFYPSLGKSDVVQAASHFYDGIMSAASSAAYDIAGPECKNPKIDLDRAQKALQNTGQSCTSTQSGPLTPQSLENMAEATKATQTDLENTFLAKLADQESRELTCAADFAKALPQNKNAFETIQYRLKMLREARAKLTEAVESINKNDMTRGQICPMTLDDLRPNPMMEGIYGYDPLEKTCRTVIAARQAVQIITASIPLSGTKSVGEFIDKYSVRRPAAEAEQIDKNLAADLAKAYEGAQGELNKESDRFKKISTPTSVADAGREVKGSLISDPLMVQNVIKSAGSEGDSLQGVACSLDAKYGKGAQLLQTGLFVGSLALSGGSALVLRAGSVASRAIAATRFARMQGLMSFQSARMLALGAGTLDAVSVAETITRTCNKGDAPQMKIRQGQEKSCQMAPQIENINQDSCYFEATLSAGPYAVLGLGLISRKAGEVLAATEKDRETVGLISSTTQGTFDAGVITGPNTPSSTSSKTPTTPVRLPSAGSVPHRGKLLSPGAQENYVYLHDTDPNKVVKVQITDPAEYRSSANPTSVEQTTQINKARFARKEVIQNTLLQVPEKDRIPVARMEFYEGYAYQDYAKDGMTLAEFQKQYGDQWKAIQEEFNRRLKISSNTAYSEMNKYFRETPNRPATLGDQLAGTARPDANPANFIIKIPPGGPSKVRVEDITWIDW